MSRFLQTFRGCTRQQARPHTSFLQFGNQLFFMLADLDDLALVHLPSFQETAEEDSTTLADSLAVLHHDLWEPKTAGLVLRFPENDSLVACLEGLMPVCKHERTSTYVQAVVFGRPAAEFARAFIDGAYKHGEVRSVFVCRLSFSAVGNIKKIHFANARQWKDDVYSLPACERFATVLRSTFTSPGDLMPDSFF